MIINRTLPLATGNQGVAVAETGRKRRALGIGNEAVVRRWPAFLRHIKPCINWQAQIVEPAHADVEIRNGGRADSPVVTNCDALAARVFSTAVLAHSGAERVLRQAQQFPVTKPAKDTLIVGNSLVYTGNVFVDVAAGAGRFYEIVTDSAAQGWWNKLVQ